MIARITFNLRGSMTQATLDERGHWTCSDKSIEDHLNFKSGLMETDPALGDPLRRHAYHMAELLGGTVEITPKPDIPDDRIY